MPSLAAVRTASASHGLALAIGLLAAGLAASLLYSPAPIVLVAGAAASLYFLSRPYELLLVMVFLIPFNFVFRVGPIPVAAELLKVLAWIPFLFYLRGRGLQFKTSKYNKWFAVVGGLLLLSIFRAHDLPFTLKESVRLGSNIGLCYLVLNLVDSREKVLQVFRVLTVSTFFVACYGFYQFAIKDFGALFWIVNPRLETSLSPGRFTFWPWRNRITSVLTSEMELGHYFNLCLPVGVLLWLTERRKRIGSTWLLMVLSMLAGLLLTFTFGAWLSLAVTTGCFVLLLSRGQRWKMALAGVLVLSLATAVLAFGPLRPLVEAKAFEGGAGSLAWDFATRFDIWTLALNVFTSHPLLGVGYGNFSSLSAGALEWLTQEWVPSGSSPHDVYLYLLSELGLVGFVTLVFVFVNTIRSDMSIRAMPELGYVGLALAFALTTVLIGGFSDDSALYGPHTSYVFWLFIGISEAVRNLAPASPGTGG